MARARGGNIVGVAQLARTLERLERSVRLLEARVALQERELRKAGRSTAARDRREKVVSAALGLGPRAKVGDRGRLAELHGTVVGLQDYLLRTSERIDTILTALKEHREFLVQLDKRVLHTGTRERIRMELDIMKNTLSIVSLAGVEVDDALLKEIDKLRATVLKEGGDVDDLRKTKEALDKRYEEELKRFDLEAIWAKRREIPGYR